MGIEILLKKCSRELKPDISQPDSDLAPETFPLTPPSRPSPFFNITSEEELYNISG